MHMHRFVVIAVQAEAVEAEAAATSAHHAQHTLGAKTYFMEKGMHPACHYGLVLHNEGRLYMHLGISA